MTSEELSYLRAIDSPTIANAIERLQGRDRCEGYIGGSVRCMFPELGVMVGYALTVTMDSQPGPGRRSRGSLANVGSPRGGSCARVSWSSRM